MSIFIPKTITAGFVERDDTYTGKLSYIIYTDEKGVLRKEKSLDSWRDKNIDTLTFDNTPTSGFVLNKKVGGYKIGWNHRQTYVRVYDPRGIEFEISIPNLLYILENTNSIKGKGLEGEFVYGWDGTELLLIPTSAPDYKELTAYNEAMHNKVVIKAKDLKIGTTYKSKSNVDLIYMGKFDYYNDYLKGKHHFFAKLRDGKPLYCYDYQVGNYDFEIMKSVNDKLISIVDEKCVENYADIFNELENRTSYSPLDNSKNEYIQYTLAEINKILNNDEFWCLEFYLNSERYKIYLENRYDKSKRQYSIEKHRGYNRMGFDKLEVLDNIEDIFNKYSPCYLVEYLANGRLYRVGKKNE